MKFTKRLSQIFLIVGFSIIILLVLIEASSMHFKKYRKQRFFSALKNKGMTNAGRPCNYCQCKQACRDMIRENITILYKCLNLSEEYYFNCQCGKVLGHRFVPDRTKDEL